MTAVPPFYFCMKNSKRKSYSELQLGVLKQGSKWNELILRQTLHIVLVFLIFRPEWARPRSKAGRPGQLAFQILDADPCSQHKTVPLTPARRARSRTSGSGKSLCSYRLLQSTGHCGG